MIIAVDFDGTLFENKYPDIGEPKWNVINWCKAKREAGGKLILWTCRDGQDLANALEACTNVGLFFDKVNSNLDEKIEWHNNDSRKIGADIYIDDKAIRPEEII